MTATNQIAMAMAIPRKRPCTALYKLLAIQRISGVGTDDCRNGEAVLNCEAD
jgi:hypothetical protein